MFDEVGGQPDIFNGFRFVLYVAVLRALRGVNEPAPVAVVIEVIVVMAFELLKGEARAAPEADDELPESAFLLWGTRDMSAGFEKVLDIFFDRHGQSVEFEAVLRRDGEESRRDGQRGV
jgi:hypothetical protein